MWNWFCNRQQRQRGKKPKINKKKRKVIHQPQTTGLCPTLYANLQSVDCTSVLLTDLLLCVESQTSHLQIQDDEHSFSSVLCSLSTWWVFSLFCSVFIISLTLWSQPVKICQINAQTYSILVYSLNSSGFTGQRMESIPSSPEMKQPGETLSLSCRGSGFSFGCCSMHWIRQPAGKALEWIGRVYSDASRTDYSSRVQDRIEISRDNSNSMVYLRLSNLRPEDSAVYYCAKHTVLKIMREALQKLHRLKNKTKPKNNH